MQRGMTRKEACFYLGVSENASCEEIKRAYRYKAKLYHPDMNPDKNTKDYYFKIQEAYEFLINNPYTKPYNVVPNMQRTPVAPNVYVRPAKIFSSNAQTKATYNRQKDKEKEVEKLHKWDAENRENKRYHAVPNNSKTPMTEQEALEKIRAIWLAENIKKQIEIDKRQKEAMQRRRLYEAFVQHDMNK